MRLHSRRLCAERPWWGLHVDRGDGGDAVVVMVLVVVHRRDGGETAPGAPRGRVPGGAGAAVGVFVCHHQVGRV